MPATIIDGKALARQIREEIRRDTEIFLREHGRPPGLAVILVRDDPASKTYVRNKGRACDEVGFFSRQEHLPATTPQKDLIALVESFNRDASIDGILVQHPMPKHIDEATIFRTIESQKDVDGFHPLNVGNLCIGQECLISCTPLGVIEMLRRYEVPLLGKRAVIAGRSNIVGKPMIQLLLREHATVTVCHSRTVDLPGECRNADVLIVAIGKPEFVRADSIKPGATVIDVGTNFIERDGKNVQVGDVAFEEAKEIAAAISPSPGGVGPMTITMLLSNTLQAARWHVK
ncbi:MAG TPA: bifunctional methylenetetrahydrofolate dehydrogenase/methenyltetrahydrofolate cyclohydrolase FolD [bacterium]|nr:bifunctional methylenetetrahydrofolate dehydrogenase/methenyltetrahydrofolate cyclohydrolase FolD [bacterium]